MSDRPRVVWLARDDLVAHGYLASTPRALCGAPPIAQKLAWPSDTRCTACLQVATDRQLTTRSRNP